MNRIAMSILAAAAACGLMLGAACSSSSTSSSGDDDAGDAHTEGSVTPAHDAAAPRAFGAACEAGSDCDDGVCFVGPQAAFCSIRCEAGADCPNPPTSGVCNDKGYCK